MKRFRIILLFLHFFVLGISQDLPSPIYETIDSLVVYSADSSADSLLYERPETDNATFPKYFEEQFQSKYKGEEYDYSIKKTSESLWQKIKKKIIRWLDSLLGNADPGKSTSSGENILWFFAIVLGGLLIYFLIKIFINKNGNFFFNKKKEKLNIHHQNLQENIHEINFPESISNFERQHDYRSAIRYQFLLVLKKLADQKNITWNPEKTNKDYLLEIKKPQLKEGFKELIYIFDNVWYGEFVINEDKYNQFKQKFSNFK